MPATLPIVEKKGIFTPKGLVYLAGNRKQQVMIDTTTCDFPLERLLDYCCRMQYRSGQHYLARKEQSSVIKTIGNDKQSLGLPLITLP
jgi:hypothetical protein